MIETIKKYGTDYTSEILAEYINQKIPSEDIAIQFILEELEAASQGNDKAKSFAFNSGFDENDYLGAMYNSFEEVDGEGGPQHELLNLCLMLYPDQDLMAELRIKTVDNIMKYWKLGKYASVNSNLRLINTVKKVNNLAEGIFANINNDLNESIDEDSNIMILMSYGYARRIAAAGLLLQGVFNKNNYIQALNIFKSLQLETGQSIEFQEEAFSQALELVQSYDSRLTKNCVSNIIGAVESNQIENAYNEGKYFNYEYVIQIFLK